MEIETIKEHCKHPDCQFRTKLTIGNVTEMCAFMLYTGEPRRDPISKCTRYKPRTTHIRVTPWDVIEEVPYDKKRIKKR